MFNGHDYVEIPHSPNFASNSFSVSMWIYVYKDPAATTKHSAQYCPILHKGTSQDDGCPSLSVHNRKVRRC